MVRVAFGRCPDEAHQHAAAITGTDHVENRHVWLQRGRHDPRPAGELDCTIGNRRGPRHLSDATGGAARDGAAPRGEERLGSAAAPLLERQCISACLKPLRAPPAPQRVHMFVLFNTLVIRDGIDPNRAHEAFLAIDEYRQTISPEIPGQRNDACADRRASTAAVGRLIALPARSRARWPRGSGLSRSPPDAVHFIPSPEKPCRW
jgi:hypothetical protein